MLTGKTNAIAASDELIGMGPKAVVVKRGEYGFVLRTKEGHFILPAFPIANVIDSLSNPRERELADYGLFLTLHEYVFGPNSTFEWSFQSEQLLGRRLNDSEHAWLVRWMTQFHQTYKIRSQLTRTAGS